MHYQVSDCHSRSGRGGKAMARLAGYYKAFGAVQPIDNRLAIGGDFDDSRPASQDPQVLDAGAALVHAVHAATEHLRKGYARGLI